MKNLIMKMGIKRKEKEYRKYITDHRMKIADAFVEMVTCPALSHLWEDLTFYNELVDRIACHDDSKFSVEEFEPYRKYYYRAKGEVFSIADDSAFERAWEHHWTNNDHHWENRAAAAHKVLTRNDKLAILENVCDWLAMGYRFEDRPYQYYEKVKEEIIEGGLPAQDIKFLEFVINALEEDKENNKNYDYGRKDK